MCVQCEHKTVAWWATWFDGLYTPQARQHLWEQVQQVVLETEPEWFTTWVAELSGWLFKLLPGDDPWHDLTPTGRGGVIGGVPLAGPAWFDLVGKVRGDDHLVAALGGPMSVEVSQFLGAANQGWVPRWFGQSVGGDPVAVALVGLQWLVWRVRFYMPGEEGGVGWEVGVWCGRLASGVDVADELERIVGRNVARGVSWDRSRF